MERWEAKVLALVVVFLIPGICNLLPYKLSDYFAKRGERGKKVLSNLMCFGGGVFFATFILHMAPESRLLLKHSLMDPYNVTYPVADLIMAGGFFLVFVLEKLTLKWHKKRQEKKRRLRKLNCPQVRKVKLAAESPSLAADRQDLRMDLSPEDRDLIIDVIPTDHKHGRNDIPGLANCCDHCIADGKTVPCSQAGEKLDNLVTDTGETVVELKTLILDAKNACPLLGTGDCCEDPIGLKSQQSAEANAMMFSPGQAIEDEETEQSHGTRSIILVVALSLHRIFEGMSVGLQQSSYAVWSLLLAVMCHETVIGFGLGLQFVKNKFTFKRMLIAVTLCSCIMPLGVAIGTTIIEVGGEDDSFMLINGVLQSIATGTFIYVTFFEILQEEIDPHDTNICEVLSCMFGFAVMAALCAIPEQNPTALHPPIVNLTHSMALTTSTSGLI